MIASFPSVFFSGGSDFFVRHNVCFLLDYGATTSATKNQQHPGEPTMSAHTIQHPQMLPENTVAARLFNMLFINMLINNAKREEKKVDSKSAQG